MQSLFFINKEMARAGLGFITQKLSQNIVL